MHVWFLQPKRQALGSHPAIDITINQHRNYGSVVFLCGEDTAVMDDLAGRIQHVRRRETIAMTPPHALQLPRNDHRAGECG